MRGRVLIVVAFLANCGRDDRTFDFCTFRCIDGCPGDSFCAAADGFCHIANEGRLSCTAPDARLLTDGMSALDAATDAWPVVDAALADAAAVDAAPVDAASVDAAPVDAATGLHVIWSVTKDELSATCAEAGVDLVRLSWGPAPDVVPFLTFPCTDGEGFADVPDGFVGWLSAVDAAGNNIVNVAVVLMSGDMEVTVLLEVFTEPAPQLAAIAAGAVSHYESNGTFPATTAITPPFGTCCGSPGWVCAPDAALWSTNPTWSALGFSVTSRGRFVYSFTSSVSGFTAAARRDLDCDASPSLYQVTGTVDAMGVVQLAPLTMTNEFE